MNKKRQRHLQAIVIRQESRAIHAEWERNIFDPENSFHFLNDSEFLRFIDYVMTVVCAHAGISL